MENKFQINNDSTGSFKVGLANVVVAKGDAIHLDGEALPRPVTSTMGEGVKLCACSKKSGPFPVGLVSFTVIPGGGEAASLARKTGAKVESIEARKARLEAELAALTAPTKAEPEATEPPAA